MSWCCLLNQDIALSHENQIVICHGTHHSTSVGSAASLLRQAQQPQYGAIEICTMYDDYALCSMMSLKY